MDAPFTFGTCRIRALEGRLFAESFQAWVFPPLSLNNCTSTAQF